MPPAWLLVVPPLVPPLVEPELLLPEALVVAIGVAVAPAALVVAIGVAVALAVEPEVLLLVPLVPAPCDRLRPIILAREQRVSPC